MTQPDPLRSAPVAQEPSLQQWLVETREAERREAERFPKQTDVDVLNRAVHVGRASMCSDVLTELQSRALASASASPKGVDRLNTPEVLRIRLTNLIGDYNALLERYQALLKMQTGGRLPHVAGSGEHVVEVEPAACSLTPGGPHQAEGESYHAAKALTATSRPATDKSVVVPNWEGAYKGVNKAFSALFRQWEEVDALLGVYVETPEEGYDDVFHAKRMARVRALLNVTGPSDPALCVTCGHSKDSHGINYLGVDGCCTLIGGRHVCGCRAFVQRAKDVGCENDLPWELCRACKTKLNQPAASASPHPEKDVFPAIQDALDKHCRGFMTKPTTRGNIAELIDRICTTYEKEVQQRQLFQRQLEAVDRAIGFPHEDGKGRIEMINELSALPASPHAKGEDWQPIETAPKDRAVLVSLKPYPLQERGEITFGYFTTETDEPGGIWTRDETGERIEPEFWFDVPLPPSARPASLEEPQQP